MKDRTGDGLFYNSDGLLQDNINHYLLEIKFIDRFSMWLFEQAVNHNFKVRHIDDVSRVVQLQKYSDLPRLIKSIITRKLKKLKCLLKKVNLKK